MFIYIHIISYYKLFLYFNMCLRVKSNSLLCSFTSIYFLTSIKGLPSSGFELYCSNYKNVFVYFDFDLWNISIVKMGISHNEYGMAFTHLALFSYASQMSMYHPLHCDSVTVQFSPDLYYSFLNLFVKNI